MKRGQFLNLTVLLVCMLCAIAASAYDFEVDGIYYNKTSNNTVEVTYNTIGEYTGTYNGTVVIPSTVTYNNVIYTVTAIGDSAFYGRFIYYNPYPSHINHDVTIPETVTSIGKDAFAKSQNFIIKCLPMIPPEMDGAFGELQDVGNEFPFSLFDETDYIYPRPLDDGYSGIILFVQSEAYQVYKEMNETFHYFKWIFCEDWEKTLPPSVDEKGTYSWEELVGTTVTFSSNEESTIYYDASYSVIEWGEGDINGIQYINDSVVSIFYSDIDVFTSPADYIIRGVAVAEGKLPSDVIVISGRLSPPYAHEEDSIFEIDGIYYDSEGYIIGHYYDHDDLIQINYSGDIVLPTHVIGANEDAFTYCSGITSLSIPFECWLELTGCVGLKKIVLPISSETISWYSGYEPGEINHELLYLFGDGDMGWISLPGGSVDTLYLGRGMTGFNMLPISSSPATIYSYATTPPTFNGNENDLETDFDAELHVPASALAAYFTAPYWCNFTNIIGDINPITDFSLSRDSIEMLKGSEYSFQPIVTPAHVDPGYILWQSTNTNVATVNNGVVTAVGTGECEIQAICQGIFVVCRVIVTEILPTEVTLSQESAKMEVGGQLTLTATVLPENATDQTVTWSSSKTSVATVDNGVVTAVAPGECDIIASCGGKQARCHIVVVEHFIYISLDEHEATLLPNHILTLTPTVTPVSTELKVTSTNPSVAAARLAGNKIQVVGIHEGEAMIVVQSVDGEAEPDTCRVTVYTELGDVDCDGYVSIADVTALIDLLLGNDNPSYSLENADCDQDGELGISDATILIDALLGSMTLPDKDAKSFTVNGVAFKMVKVKGGTFTMGATEEEDSDYQVFVGSPKHQVTLSDYYIGQTEVTQELWAAVMGSNPSYDTTNPLYPVNSVSWEDCAAFISQLNALTGLQFRLPTEAEWEFAAQGGTKSRGYVYAGSNDLDEVAWFYTNSDNTCHQVGTKKPNELGLYDMNGNIEEWCNDWYSLYTAEAVVNPTGPETGLSRIHRGGRWSGGERYCRLTRRDGFRPNVVRNYMGLRLAL